MPESRGGPQILSGLGHKPRRSWMKLNYDTGAAVAVLPKAFAADAVSSDAQY